MPPPRRVSPDVELLAIDPGVVHPAAARFSGGRLVAASRTPVDASWLRFDVGQRGLCIALAIRHWELTLGLPPVTHIVYEHPQVYRTADRKDSNDLLKILTTASTAVGLFAAAREITVLSPLPREVWNNLPKATSGDPWESVRGKRIWSRLDDAQRAVIVPSHDSLDAVGLGLFVLGLFEPVRVFAGAT